jgi:hypothetical protein
MNIRQGLTALFMHCTASGGTRRDVVFSYLNTSRSDFGERSQPVKAMFSRATLGLGRLLFSGERR